jgi:hypothetical protein
LAKDPLIFVISIRLEMALANIFLTSEISRHKNSTDSGSLEKEAGVLTQETS